MKRTLAIVASAAVALAASTTVLTGGVATAATAAPKAGGACQKKQVNRNVGTLVCTKEGSKYVWRQAQVTATTVAAVTGGAGKADSDLKGTEISFIHWRAEDKTVFESINKKFEDKTGIKVKMNIYPSNDYQSNALNLIKDGQLGDVFTAFRGAQFFNIAKAGIYTDLGNQPFVKNYAPASQLEGKWEGKQLGLPYHLVFNMPVVNTELLKKLGVELPTRLEEMPRFCAAVKAKGVAPIAWPGGEAANAGQLSMNGLVMNNLPSDDGFTQIDTGKAKVTDFWMTRSLEQFKQLADDCFQDNSIGTNTNGAIALFAQEKALMLATGTFHMGAALAINPNMKFKLWLPDTSASGQKGKYEGIHNVTFILGVNSKSQGKKQEAALKYVEFLSQADIAGEYAAGTKQAVGVNGVKYTDAALADTIEWADKKTILAPRFQFLNLDIRNAVENAFVAVAGGKDPKAAAADAQKTIDEKLGVK
jgi:raffinose/stachyose/melibiose transport system substrate-binding protein